MDSYVRDCEEMQKMILRSGELMSRMDIHGLALSVVRDREKMCREVVRLRAALMHIADTCIEDPVTAQFASQVLDGTASCPEMQDTLHPMTDVESCSNCGNVKEDGDCDYFLNPCTLKQSKWKPKS